MIGRFLIDTDTNPAKLYFTCDKKCKDLVLQVALAQGDTYKLEITSPKKQKNVDLAAYNVIYSVDSNYYFNHGIKGFKHLKDWNGDLGIEMNKILDTAAVLKDKGAIRDGNEADLVRRAQYFFYRILNNRPGQVGKKKKTIYLLFFFSKV